MPRYVQSIGKSAEHFLPRGGNMKAWKYRGREMVVTGGVNTGKTYGLMQKAHRLCITFPKCKILLLCKTFTQLNKAAVETYEGQVLGYKPTRDTDVKKIETRDESYYLYPNDARIILGGYTKSSDVLSTEYDFIFVIQAELLTEEEWVYLQTRIGRGTGNNAPYCGIIGDANPHPLGEQHWMPKRAQKPKALKMFLTTRKDNPDLWDGTQWTERGWELEEMFETFPEDVRLRLGEGLWQGGDYLVFPEFKDSQHLVHWTDLVAEGVQFEKWYMGCDWGWDDPGSLSLYAMAHGGVLYQIRTTYRTGEMIDFWERRAVAYQRWVRRYFGKPISRVYCCPSAPAYIEQFRLAGLPAVKGHDGPNSLHPGLMACRLRLKLGTFKIVVDNIDGNRSKREPSVDPILSSTYRPTCLYDEISRFYQNPSERKEGALDADPLDKHNHSSDEWRYVCSATHIPPKKVHLSSRTWSSDDLFEKMGLGLKVA